MGKRITDICTETGISLNELSQKKCSVHHYHKKIVDGKATNSRVITIFNICSGLGLAYSVFFQE